MTIRTFLRRTSGTLGVLLLSLCVMGAIGAPVTPETKQEVITKATKLLDDRAYVAGIDFDKLAEHLAKHKKAIDDTTDDRAFAAAVNKAFREFGISHIRVLTPQAATNRKTTSQVGIGVTARKVDDGLVIADVIDGSPAEAAGVRQGDLIIKIDGQEVASTEPLAGEEGSKVVVTVKRNGDAPIEDISIIRGKFSTKKPETLTMVGDDAAVLRIHTFSVGYDSKNVDALMGKLAESGRQLLIVDLRGNGGGRVANLREFLGYFLPKGAGVGTSVSRAMAKRYKESHDGDALDAVAIARSVGANMKVPNDPANRFTGKVAVLIDRGSASASEIFAAALRELMDAPLIGTPSAGAVLVSVHTRLTEGWELQMPTSDYVTVQGLRLEGHKLKPEIEVRGPRKPNDAAHDECVVEAIKYLKRPVPVPGKMIPIPSVPEPVGAEAGK